MRTGWTKMNLLLSLTVALVFTIIPIECNTDAPVTDPSAVVTTSVESLETTESILLPTETPEIIDDADLEQTTRVVALTTEGQAPEVVVTTETQGQTTEEAPEQTSQVLVPEVTDAAEETVAPTTSEPLVETVALTTERAVTSPSEGSTTEARQETSAVAVMAETTAAVDDAQSTAQTETTLAPLVDETTVAAPTVGSTQAIEATTAGSELNVTVDADAAPTSAQTTVQHLTTEAAAVITVTNNSVVDVTVLVTTEASETSPLNETTTPSLTTLSLTTPSEHDTSVAAEPTFEVRVDSVTAQDNSTNSSATTTQGLVTTPPAYIPTEEVTVEISTAESITTPAGPVDPCYPSGHKVIADSTRNVNNQEQSQYLSDKGQMDKANWYKFEYEGYPAQVPTDCIKSGYCSTLFPLRVELGGATLPDKGQEINATYCSISVLKDAGYVDCCIASKQLRIRKCGRGMGSFYLYMFVEEVDMENAAFCTMRPGNQLSDAQKGVAGPITTPAPDTTTGKMISKKPEIPSKTKVSVVETTVAVETTEAATTPAEQTTGPKILSTVEAKDLSDEQESGVITAVFAIGGEDYEMQDVTERFRQTLLAILKDYFEQQKKDRQRRAADEDAVDMEDLVVISPTPRLNKNGELEVAVYIRKSGNSTDEVILPRGILLDVLSLQENRQRLGKGVNMNVTDVYTGLPKDLYPTTAPKPAAASGRLTPLEAHMGLFIAMAVLAGVCIVIIIIGIIWLKCRRCCRCCQKRDKSYLKDDGDLESGNKKPLQEVHENPIPDEEITRDEAPMLEKANPAVTPNGNGNVIADDDDKNNGWIVPISELSPEELEQPEVEDTKL